MANVVLTKGKGKNKREWELTESEFTRFSMEFEESELVFPLEGDDDLLVMKDGNEKRQWSLSEDEFDTFEMEFEECELCEVSEDTLKNFKVTIH